MRLEALSLVVVAADMTAVANLLFRWAVLKGGTSPDSSLIDQLARLCLEPRFVLGVLLYGAAAIVWIAALSLENLSTGYPVLVGLTFVIVGFGAMQLFQETISLQKALGMAVIIAGIALVALAP
jgi:small multidrug resistance pump